MDGNEICLFFFVVEQKKGGERKSKNKEHKFFLHDVVFVFVCYNIKKMTDFKTEKKHSIE